MSEALWARPGWLTRRSGNLLGALACVGLMSYALYVQHGLGLEPCPLCIMQRIAVIAVGAGFLLAFLHHPGRLGARVYGVAIPLLAVGGLLISARHVWIQFQPPGSVAACGASLDYMLDILPVWEVAQRVFTGSGECAKIDWQLLGLSMPWWVGFSFISLSIWGMLVNLALPARFEGTGGR